MPCVCCCGCVLAGEAEADATAMGTPVGCPLQGPTGGVVVPKGKYINHGARMTLLASRGFIADEWARLEKGAN